MKLRRNCLNDWEETIDLAWRDIWGDVPPARLKPIQRKIVLALMDIQRTVHPEARKAVARDDEKRREP